MPVEEIEGPVEMVGLFDPRLCARAARPRNRCIWQPAADSNGSGEVDDAEAVVVFRTK